MSWHLVLGDATISSRVAHSAQCVQVTMCVRDIVQFILHTWQKTSVAELYTGNKYVYYMYK